MNVFRSGKACGRTCKSKLGQSQVRKRTNLGPPTPSCSNSADAMEGASTVYPISCEHCRTKKSRCDRELPTCTQCASSGIDCRYPPVNKRGIPSGYLSYIEQRLLDTEVVVFELLSAVYKSHVPIQPQRLSEAERQALADLSQKQAKSAKIEEWKRLPLDTDKHRHEWWSRRCQSMFSSTQAGSTRSLQDAMSPQDTWVDASPLSVQFEDTQTCTATRPSFSDLSQTADPAVSWQQSLNVDLSGTGVNFDDSVPSKFTSSSTSNLGQDASDIAKASAQLSVADNSQVLNAERWRKYF
ncbi:hypothetical protein HBI69_178960 [Parastagonospora nodorum]|nr:hypothetical protein HBI69_178960 [Parastagonospora nodorum]